MPRAERHDEPGLTPAERELVGALRGLSPSASGIDRDRLLFDAGAEAGRAGARRVVGAVAGALIVALAVALLWPPQPRVVERVVYVAAPAGEGVPITQVAEAEWVRPSTAPVALASLDPVPFPVPGGPFVPVPRNFVGRMAVDSSVPTAAYLEKIQHVLQNGWTALPPTRGRSNDADGDTRSPPSDSLRRS